MARASASLISGRGGCKVETSKFTDESSVKASMLMVRQASERVACVCCWMMDILADVCLGGGGGGGGCVGWAGGCWEVGSWGRRCGWPAFLSNKVFAIGLSSAELVNYVTAVFSVLEDW